MHLCGENMYTLTVANTNLLVALCARELLLAWSLYYVFEHSVWYTS